MKKTIKILLSTFLLTLTVILSFSLIAYARNYKGEINDGVYWEVNTDTKTLYLSGNGGIENLYPLLYEGELWSKHANFIKNIVIEKELYFEDGSDFRYFTDKFSFCSPHAKNITFKGENDCYFEYITETETLILHGEGSFNDDRIFGKSFYKNLIIDNGITEFFSDRTINYYNIEFDSVYLGKDLTSITNIHAKKYYSVDQQNPYFSSYNGDIYTKDYTKLLKCYYRDNNNNARKSIDFHPNVYIIGENTLSDVFFAEGNIIIPWGVTILEDAGFSSRNSYANYILPDTLTHFPDSIYSTEYGKIILSGNNKKLVSVSNEYKIASDYYSYYDIKPNSLKTFQNGKTYYFDNNYKMAKGWKKVNGIWYYFNDYGAAVVKIWLKSGGKWYYMQEDGTMATNKWIKWYNKWYYVGKDGAMYTNRKTPDGYYVNASGVWVK